MTCEAWKVKRKQLFSEAQDRSDELMILFVVKSQSSLHIRLLKVGEIHSVFSKEAQILFTWQTFFFAKQRKDNCPLPACPGNWTRADPKPSHNLQWL